MSSMHIQYLSSSVPGSSSTSSTASPGTWQFACQVSRGFSEFPNSSIVSYVQILHTPYYHTV